MLPIKKHKAIQAILLCALLTANRTKPMTVDCINPTASQSYTILYCASFCLGVALYALIHKYCGSQPTVILKQSPLEKKTMKNNFFDPLQTTTNRIEANQQDIIEFLIEQKKTTDELNTKLIDLQASINGITKKAKIMNEQNTQLLTEIDTFYAMNDSVIPLCLTLYLTNIRKKQAPEKQPQESKDITMMLPISNEEKI